MTPRKIQGFPEIVKFSVAAQYKSSVSGVAVGGIAGSNPAGEVNIGLLWVLFVVG